MLIPGVVRVRTRARVTSASALMRRGSGFGVRRPDDESRVRCAFGGRPFDD